MKRLILSLSVLVCQALITTALAQDDIEVTDSTSTEWGSGTGGGLIPQNPTGSVTSLTLSQTELTMEGGKRARLYATFNADAANKNVTWTSSNDVVAVVYPTGVVRALSHGTAVITATAAGNTAISRTCVVTVTSDYNGLALPDVPFEFCYNAEDFDVTTNSIPNHPGANLEDYALQLSANIPTFIDGSILRINSRCEGYINRWEKGSVASGSYFYSPPGITMVAKVAPRKDTGNTCDFISNRGNGYNYMWRIGDNNTSFLHTGQSYESGRALYLDSEEPQILSVRVGNDEIKLDNLTTGESRLVGGIWWGQGETVFKLFYNDDNEFFTGDFYWVYYSFEYLTDEQLNIFKEGTVLLGDANGDGEVDVNDITAVVNYIQGNAQSSFNIETADVNNDGEIDVNDITGIVNIIQQ